MRDYWISLHEAYPEIFLGEDTTMSNVGAYVAPVGGVGYPVANHIEREDWIYGDAAVYVRRARKKRGR